LQSWSRTLRSNSAEEAVSEAEVPTSVIAGVGSGSYLSAMSVKEIRELYSAAPFRPFEIMLTNGAKVFVGHPEFMMFSPDYQTVYAADVQNGGTKRIDVKMIIALNELKNGARPRKR
jgi:hypothetical protein